MQSLSGSSRPEMGRTGPVLSELTVGKNPRNCEEDYCEVTSSLLESQESESKSTQWTNEKHCLYLKSMEASFVNELYNSLGCSQQECTSKPWQNHNGVPTPSGQFKVFKDGSWEKVNFRTEMPRQKRADKSNSILANPWIQHYRSSCRRRTGISHSRQGQAPVSTIVDPSAFQFGGQNSIGSNAEMTDQNFVDEVSEEEKSSRKRYQKCRKISAAVNSCKDQVRSIRVSSNMKIGNQSVITMLKVCEFIVQVVPFAKLSLIDDEVHGSPKE